MNHSIKELNDAKQVFKQKGTCSQTFFYLLNREFGHLKKGEEQATDPLAGGIMREGHQCGMLWGAAMAVGAEAHRRCENLDQAIAVAVRATQHLLKSFADRTDTLNCREITDTDFNKTWQMLKFMVFKSNSCFKLAEAWAPEAVQAAMEGLANTPPEQLRNCVSCAAEVARRMGASGEEMAMVAGFAGGLGLSGEGCGALSAAIWMNTLDWSKKHPGKQTYSNPAAEKTLEAFYELTEDKILCREISGQQFDNLEEHAAFINKGGCEEVIKTLAQTWVLVE